MAQTDNSDAASKNTKESGVTLLSLAVILVVILVVVAIIAVITASVLLVSSGNQAYGPLIAAVVGLIAVVIVAILNGAVFEPSRAEKEREHQRKMGIDEREYQRRLNKQKQETKEQEERNRSEAQKTQLRNSLYSEMAHAYCMFKNLLSHQPTLSSLGDLSDVMQSRAEIRAWLDKTVNPRTINALSCFDVYNFTRRDPTLFYQLPDPHAIDSFYRALSWSLDPNASNAPIDGAPFAPRTLFWLKYFISELEATIVGGAVKLDIGLLKQFAENEYCLQYLTELEEQPENVKKEFGLLALLAKAITEDVRKSEQGDVRH